MSLLQMAGSSIGRIGPADFVWMYVVLGVLVRSYLSTCRIYNLTITGTWFIRLVRFLTANASAWASEIPNPRLAMNASG
jgi:hypothetical protein